jgi:hypothetical protein
VGADLYVEDLPREKQYTGFRTDVGVGYFRDAYNTSNLLWQFGLSYWTDVAKRFCETKDGWSVMVPAKAKLLLEELKARETTFEQNLKDMSEAKNRVWDYASGSSDDGEAKYRPNGNLTPKDRKEWVKQYRKDYETLKRFLSKAIQLNSNVLCSL